MRKFSYKSRKRFLFKQIFESYIEVNRDIVKHRDSSADRVSMSSCLSTLKLANLNETQGSHVFYLFGELVITNTKKYAQFGLNL